MVVLVAGGVCVGDSDDCGTSTGGSIDCITSDVSIASVGGSRH